MDRRKFINKTGKLAATAFLAPYILPSGRLFAQTGSKMAEHVVYVLFAGGVRQQESVLQRYLDDSQGLPYAGNIMTNTFSGAAPTQKIVYGTGSGGPNPIPAILSQSLEAQGTIFKEVASSTAAHYGGLNALLQGNTANTQGLKSKPVYPTIFEYLRKHGGYPATKVWFVGNGIGNSVPLLNHSNYAGYGAEYGANFFAPTFTFGDEGFDYLSNAKVYHPEDQLSPMYQMKYFLDNSFKNLGNSLPLLNNTEDEKQDIKLFMKEMFDKTSAGTIDQPPVADSGDLQTIGYACELMKWFKPALTVVNMNNVDGCHSDFTGYLRSLHRADHGLGHLWNCVQSIPEMANNTILIAMPECGRNLEHNNIKDTDNQWFAYDHSDTNSRRVFGVMAGPGVPSNLQVGSEANPIGLTTDGVPTIAEILGGDALKNQVLGSGFLAPDSMSLFDRI
jgi:hypothetical protein